MKGKLALFTPLPPTKSGIADYSIELGEALTQYWQVIFVIADDAPEPIPLPDGTSYLRLNDWNQEGDGNIPRFYQMGNNIYHEYILRELQQKPGVTLLHDFSMHHLLVELTLAHDDNSSYKKLMEQAYGRVGKELAEYRENNIHHGIMEFLLPLNQEVLSNSKGVIVHSASSLRELQFKHSDVISCMVPFPYKEVDSSLLLGGQDLAKKSLGIKEGRLIIASFGFVTPPKQIELTLNALSNCKSDIPDFEYILVGEVSPAVPVARLVAELGLEDNVRVTGFVSFEEFHHYIEASDLIISLRYPSAGETSAALMRAMGMGRANIVFDYASYSGFSDDVIIKVPLDTRDSSELQGAIKKVANDKAYRKKIAKAAENCTKDEHQIDDVAAEITNFITECYEDSSLCK